MDMLRKNPVALYAVVLALSVAVDTVLGLALNFSLFDFWTQFFLGIILSGLGGGVSFAVLRVLEKNGIQLGESRPPVLLTTGLYRISRNPLYIGMTVLYLGLAVLFDAPLALLAFMPVFYHTAVNVIPAEEARLEAIFDGDYLKYRDRVGRWF